jgi:hypothetical protein
VQVRAAWSRALLCDLEVPGAKAGALDALVEALSSAGLALPAQATLVLPDEQVYLTLRPAQHNHRAAIEDARQYFALTLGRADLTVQVAGSGAKGTQLAAAAEPSAIGTWRESLLARGIALAGVELALLEDLNACARQLNSSCTVALLRDEGMSVVQVEDGRLSDVAWERCDPHGQRCMEQRLTAGSRLAEEKDPPPMYLVCQTEAQRELWTTHAKGHGWTILLGNDAMQRAANGAVR